MSTIQIVGIAVAVVIVVLLVVALLVTRKSGTGEAGEAPEAAENGSFLDAPPSDTLSKLGSPEHVPAAMETEGPDVAAAAPPGVVRTATGVASAAGGLGLDWDRGSQEPAVEPAPVDESETTGEMPAVVAPEIETMPPAEPEPEVEAKPPAASDKLVPLSSIIVTTSTRLVDLGDPEIRRMLTDLVTFEIDQATQFREQGQSIDAVLQLTEAEKICRALGKDDTALEIRDMMRGLKA